MTAKTPSGHDVFLTAEEEVEAVREALKQKAAEDALQKDYLQKAMTDAAVSAAGNAVGFAIAGLILYKIIGLDR